MILSGFSFSGYRSFGGSTAIIAPLQKINFIIGANNSGKSNVMRIIHEHKSLFSGNITKFNDLDRPQVGHDAFKFSIAVTDNEIDAICKQITKRSESQSALDDLIWLYSSDLLRHIYGAETLTWLNIVGGNPNFDVEVAKQLDTPDNFSWRRLQIETAGSYFENDKSNIPSVLSTLEKHLPKLEFESVIIPAIRQVGAASSNVANNSDFSGAGIIERLQKLERPEITNQADKKIFSKINKFLQSVLENESAILEIPHDKSMIIVHMDGKTLPLESLGTGIHEVVILAAAATILEKTVVCIEEPELHLHPILQRKLINYLNTDTDNQYFITTHSAHLLDATEAQIFHVSMVNGVSKVSTVSNTRERSELCSNLGYKGSDILQANCIIWVEGPSDRTYINYWIKAKNQFLKEGIHYSIMFYGGRLSSHISGLDPDETKEHEEELISLRQLNRNSVIVIDSDKASPQSRINKTKKRLEIEFNKGPGFAWVTEGREIENYLDEEKLEQAVINSHPKSCKALRSKGKWANQLEFMHLSAAKNKSKPYPTANKVKVANYYTENFHPNLNKYGLEKKIMSLIHFIKRSNGM